jgi:beta-phosphoglucomutase-like phosphatase (HAD superfamily)
VVGPDGGSSGSALVREYWEGVLRRSWEVHLLCLTSALYPFQIQSGFGWAQWAECAELASQPPCSVLCLAPGGGWDYSWRMKEGMHMSAHGYFFDMDGTLIDTEVLWVEATAAYLADCDIPVADDWVQGVVYGRSWRDVHAAVAKLDARVDLPIEIMQAQMDPYFRRLRDARDVRMHSSIDCLRRCAAKAPLCIVSGSSRHDVDSGIDLMGIGDLVDFSLAAEDYSPGKPHPACFMLAVERMGIDPSRGVVFEDSCAGITAARETGLKCVALQVAGRPVQDFAGADQVVADLADYDEVALFA